MYELIVTAIGLWALFTVEASFEEILLLVITTVLLVCEIKIAKKYEIEIVRNVVLLFSVSMLLAYSYGEIQKIPITLLAGGFLFLMMYFIGKTRFYKWRIVGFATVCFIPILLVCTRVLGEPVVNTDSYISIGPFLTLAWILLCFPFAMGFFLRNEVKLPWISNVISLNHVFMLVWMVVNAYLAGVINSEYGTALILYGATTVVFLLHGKYWFAKGLFCLFSVFAATKVVEKSIKAHIRFAIFQNIKEALQLYEAEAEPVIRVLDTAPLYGLWGLGHGSFQNRTAISDYVISCLLMNYGLVFSVIVICILMIFIVKICLIKTKDSKDQVLVDSYVAVLFVMTFLGLAGPMNSFVLTGVGLPFLSISGSINSCLLGGLGLVIALKEEGEYGYEKKLFG